MSNNTMKSPDSYSKSFLSDICRSFCNNLSILIKTLAEIWPSEYYSILLSNPDVVVKGVRGSKTIRISDGMLLLGDSSPKKREYLFF